MGAAHHPPGHLRGRSVGLALPAIGAILLGGLVLPPRLFRLPGGARTPDVSTATTLLIVVGLSMSPGAAFPACASWRAPATAARPTC